MHLVDLKSSLSLSYRKAVINLQLDITEATIPFGEKAKAKNCCIHHLSSG